MPRKGPRLELEGAPPPAVSNASRAASLSPIRQHPRPFPPPRSPKDLNNPNASTAPDLDYPSSYLPPSLPPLPHTDTTAPYHKEGAGGPAGGAANVKLPHEDMKTLGPTKNHHSDTARDTRDQSIMLVSTLWPLPRAGKAQGWPYHPG